MTFKENHTIQKANLDFIEELGKYDSGTTVFCVTIIIIDIAFLPILRTVLRVILHKRQWEFIVTQSVYPCKEYTTF